MFAARCADLNVSDTKSYTALTVIMHTDRRSFVLQKFKILLYELNTLTCTRLNNQQQRFMLVFLSIQNKFLGSDTTRRFCTAASKKLNVTGALYSPVCVSELWPGCQVDTYFMKDSEQVNISFKANCYCSLNPAIIRD